MTNSPSAPVAQRRDEQYFSPDELRAVSADVLGVLGVPQDLADQTAESLVHSNLLGHDSHGVQRLLQYSEWIANGQVRPDARPELTRSFGSIALVDGNWGLGQPAARRATDVAIDLALRHGVSAVTISRCNHIGRLGEYVEAMAESGCVGLAFCNSGPIVAPSGGSRRTFGTNPLAWAAPRADGPAFVLDFSTAGVAEGKVSLSLARGEEVPPGNLIDARGNPTTSPRDLYDGGALLPFGGHKGSGLALMIDLLGGLLTGMGAAPMPDYQGGNGTVFITLSIAAFTELTGFATAAAAFGERVREATDGSTEPRVMLPGQVEQETMRGRLESGIQIPDAIRRGVTQLAGQGQIDLGRFALAETE